MPAQTGGTNVYPSLEDISSLFRSMVNDDGAGQNNVPGQGQIATDTAPFMLPFMNSAMRDVFSDLRIVNSQTLIFDNYIVIGLPAVYGAYGGGAPDPATQTYLGFNGFYDGHQNNPNFVLPIYTRNVTRVWERISGQAVTFTPMQNARDGLDPCQQQTLNGAWEYRGDAIWMPGSLLSMDLRIRGTLNFVNFISNAGSLNFSTTYFPVQDSTNSVVDKMLIRYARRFAPDRISDCMMSEKESSGRLRQEYILQKQATENFRPDFADIAGDGFPWGSQL